MAEVAGAGPNQSEESGATPQPPNWLVVAQTHEPYSIVHPPPTAPGH